MNSIIVRCNDQIRGFNFPATTNLPVCTYIANVEIIAASGHVVTLSKHRHAEEQRRPRDNVVKIRLETPNQASTSTQVIGEFADRVPDEFEAHLSLYSEHKL